MEWMDGARRRGGLIWVGAGVLFQLAWLLMREKPPGPITVALCLLVVALAVVTIVAQQSLLAVIAAWILAVALGLDLMAAIADRFGLFGPPGSAGVSWGSWEHFVAYTGELLGPVLAPASPVAALLATLVEAVLSVLLVSGWQRRWAGKLTAGLLTIYLVAMAFTVGLDEVARYGMPLLIGGALLISAVPARRPRRKPGAARDSANGSAWRANTAARTVRR